MCVGADAAPDLITDGSAHSCADERSHPSPHRSAHEEAHCGSHRRSNVGADAAPNPAANCGPTVAPTAIPTQLPTLQFTSIPTALPTHPLLPTTCPGVGGNMFAYNGRVYGFLSAGRVWDGAVANAKTLECCSPSPPLGRRRPWKRS
jgi:hypothetical protein